MADVHLKAQKPTPSRQAEMPKSGWVGREQSDIKRRLLYALFESYRKSRKLTIRILNLATVDVLGMCLYASPLYNTGVMHSFRIGVLYSYRRGL